MAPGPTHCVYVAKSLKGTLELETGFGGGGLQLVVTFSKAKMKRDKSSAAVCDKTATISGSFGYANRSDGAQKAFGVGHYIFGKLE